MRYLVLMLLLTACGDKTIFTPTVVDVPIATSCKVETPAEPIWALDSVKRTDPLLTKAKALLEDREMNKAYDEQLVAALKACSGI